MKFNRDVYLKYVEQMEAEYAAHSNYEDTLTNEPLNKPIPSFDGGVCIQGSGFTVFFDCVLSGCEQGNTTWATYIGLYEDSNNAHLHYRTWQVNCPTMEMFKVLVNSICECENFAQIVALAERSDWCET